MGQYTDGQLAANTDHTCRIQALSSTTDPLQIDCVAVVDTRYNYDFSENVVDGVIQGGPQLYPGAVDVQFKDAPSALQVVGGKVSSSEWADNDVRDKQAMALSNDGGDTWQEQSNVTSFTESFANPGARIRLRVTLSRYTTDTSTTPATGDTGQAIERYTLQGELDDTPIVVDRSFDGQLLDVLNELADLGDFIWEYRRDASGESVEWTTAGQRTDDRKLDPSTYTAEKTTAAIVDTARSIAGGSGSRPPPIAVNIAWIRIDCW